MAYSRTPIVDGTTTVFAARGSGSGSLGVAPALDATQALGFSLVGNDLNEQYRINSVRIRLIAAVPDTGVACENIDPDAATVDPDNECFVSDVPSDGIVTRVVLGLLLLLALAGLVIRAR